MRLLTRRPRATLPSPPVAPDQRADELRRKLAESREVVAERDEFEAGEVPVDLVLPDRGEADERRRELHERGRQSVDRMRGGPAAE